MNTTKPARRVAFAAIAAALALTVTGCGTDITGTNTANGAAHSDVPDNYTEADVLGPKVGEPGIEWKTWGEPFTTNGVTVTVSEPVAFKPTKEASPTNVVGPIGAKLMVKIENKRDTILDSYTPTLNASVWNGPALGIVDRLSGVPSSPERELLPGREQTYAVAFDADPAASDFAVKAEVRPSTMVGVWMKDHPAGK